MAVVVEFGLELEVQLFAAARDADAVLVGRAVTSDVVFDFVSDVGRGCAHEGLGYGDWARRCGIGFGDWNEACGGDVGPELVTGNAVADVLNNAGDADKTFVALGERAQV